MTESGIVIRSTGSAYTVRMGDGTVVEARLKGKIRLSGTRSTNPVAVGDRVTLKEDAGSYVISDISERTNYIVRRSTNLSKQTHVLAANVDQALLVCTINHPETSTVFIDRFLASAEAYGVETVIVFNKTDLCSEEEKEELTYRTAVYREMGYTVLHISALSGVGIDDLRPLLKNKLTAITGHSGVGKSTLINTLIPGLDIRTNEISEANNTGKHTTTFAEMYTLPTGGDIIDTPGIRGFGIINIDKAEVAHYFRDIFKVSADCKYPNCTHTHEPGCAVRTAVEEHRIAPTRYESYLNIMEEDEAKYRQGY